MTRNA
ncbi:Protein of unknown function [Thermobacillus xylanilyticus]|jgi:hypothetical protein